MGEIEVVMAIPHSSYHAKWEIFGLIGCVRPSPILVQVATVELNRLLRARVSCVTVCGTLKGFAWVSTRMKKKRACGEEVSANRVYLRVGAG